jgi:hypothetical protein
MANNIKLKEALLSTNLFIDNDYLIEYIKLVTNYLKPEGYTEQHHVIQVAYYKHLHKCTREQAERYAEADPNNYVVQLSYKDHCRAHWLLYFCTTSFLKQGNEKAVRYILEVYKKLTSESKSILEFNEEDFNLLQEYMNSIIADPESRYYSDDEEKLLRQYYPEFGIDYCMQFFPNRSRDAVRRFAHKLQLKRTNVFWTAEDEEFLRINYPIYGVKYCMEKLNRTELMIKCKANYMGIKVVNLSKYNRLWTDEELDILKNNYEQFGLDRCVELLPNREKTAISKKASDLGLHHRKMSKKEKSTCQKQ